MDTQKDLEYDIAMESTFFERAIEDYLEDNPDVKKDLSFIKSDNLFFAPNLTIRPPKNDKEQIERISLIVRAAKHFNKLTADQIVENLSKDKEHKMSRPAINAYIYGTIKAPPTREFLLALFKALKVPTVSMDTGLEMCWYKGENVELKKAHFLMSFFREIAREKGKRLPPESVKKLVTRLTSMAELFVDEELKEVKEGNKNEK